MGTDVGCVEGGGHFGGMTMAKRTSRELVSCHRNYLVGVADCVGHREERTLPNSRRDLGGSGPHPMFGARWESAQVVRRLDAREGAPPTLQRWPVTLYEGGREDEAGDGVPP